MRCHNARSDEKRKFLDSDHTGVYEQLAFVMNFMVVGYGKQFDSRAFKVGMRVIEFDFEFRIGQRGIGGFRFLRQLPYDIQDLNHRIARSDGRHADFPFPRFGDRDEHICREGDMLRQFAERHRGMPRFVADPFVRNQFQQLFQYEPVGQPLPHELLCSAHFHLSQVLSTSVYHEKREDDCKNATHCLDFFGLLTS